MIVIRLARAGTTNRPYYHIVVADKEKPRDGRFIEQVGEYDPKLPPEKTRLIQDRLEYWQKTGAVASPRVKKVIKDYLKATQSAA